jgi:hypothetical protein
MKRERKAGYGSIGTLPLYASKPLASIEMESMSPRRGISIWTAPSLFSEMEVIMLSRQIFGRIAVKDSIVAILETTLLS